MMTNALSAVNRWSGIKKPLFCSVFRYLCVPNNQFLMSKKLKFTILVALSLFFVSDAFAEIYKWTDQNGKLHFSDKKPRHLVSEKIEVQINTYESVSYDSSIFDTGKKVVMYSTSWCGYCKKAKQYFDRKGIGFTEYDIEKNPNAKRQYKKMGATGVPVILVGNKRMNGFSEKGFERIYN